MLSLCNFAEYAHEQTGSAITQRSHKGFFKKNIHSLKTQSFKIENLIKVNCEAKSVRLCILAVD